MTAPVLAGFALPEVAADSYKEETEWRGGFTQMASGTLARDLLSLVGVLAFSLEWKVIDAAAVEIIRNAYASVVAADAVFISPFGTVYTVQPRDNSPLSVNWFPTVLGQRANVSMKLRQA